MTEIEELRNRLISLWEWVGNLDIEVEELVHQVTELCEASS